MGTHCHCRDTHLPSIVMREKRLRVGEQEYSLLKAVRDTSEKYDDSIPLGYVVGELARQELADTLNNGEMEVPA